MKKSMIFVLLLSLVLSPALAAGLPLTREEAVLLLWERAGGVPYDITAHPFTDLDGRDGAAQAAAWAYNEGLVKGVGENRFAPDRLITREEWAALLRRSAARLGQDVWLPDGAAGCNDWEDVSPWADDSLYWACITLHLPWQDGRLSPQGTVTAEEAEKSLAP